MTGTDSGLNILVCTKFVVDPNQLQADTDGRPYLTRAPFRINNFDENAIEAALQLTAKTGGRVIGVSIVPELPPKDVMLKALAMGMESLYLIKDPMQAAGDALRIASILAAAVQTIAKAEGIEQWNLIVCGEASVDQYNGQVGPRVAAELDLPAVTYVTRLDIVDGHLEAERGLEDLSEIVEVDFPALTTVGMETNEPRMPTVLQIMGAGRKPIKELNVQDLEGLSIEALNARPMIRLLDIFAPPSDRKNVRIEGDSAEQIASELLRHLGEDGEV